jgi:hypothetical protein
MSGAQILGNEALQAPREKVAMNAIATNAMRSPSSARRRCSTSAAALPGERAFNHPADAGRNESFGSAAGGRLDGNAERLTGPRRPLAKVAKIAERRTLLRDNCAPGEPDVRWPDAARPTERRSVAAQSKGSANFWIVRYCHYQDKP